MAGKKRQRQADRYEEALKARVEEERRETEERIRQKASVVPITDLSGITRRSKVCSTSVRVSLDWETVAVWLRFGQAQLRQNDRKDGRWTLSAYLESATDFEHDSAYALYLPLIGLQFSATDWHVSEFSAWVDPNAGEEFCVPGPGYDPTTHEKAERCNSCDKPHVIVPEGFYRPPHNQALYSVVRGKPVTVNVGLLGEP